MFPKGTDHLIFKGEGVGAAYIFVFFFFGGGGSAFFQEFSFTNISLFICNLQIPL